MYLSCFNGETTQNERSHTSPFSSVVLFARLYIYTTHSAPLYTTSLFVMSQVSIPPDPIKSVHHSYLRDNYPVNTLDSSLSSVPRLLRLKFQFRLSSLSLPVQDCFIPSLPTFYLSLFISSFYNNSVPLLKFNITHSVFR